LDFHRLNINALGYLGGSIIKEDIHDDVKGSFFKHKWNPKDAEGTKRPTDQVGGS
jgi:hypothetical protein